MYIFLKMTAVTLLSLYGALAVIVVIAVTHSELHHAICARPLCSVFNPYRFQNFTGKLS